MMGNTKRNPVWHVYDELRTARLNYKYYSARLVSRERLNITMELILSITAPSSAVSGIFFWDTPIGSVVWKILGIIAAFVAILKPSLKLTKRIKEIEEVTTGYRALEHDLSVLKIHIEQKQNYDRALQKEFENALQKKGILKTKNPEHKEYKRLKTRCEAEVIEELPVEAFYIS